jgi:hypothetical protein
MCQKTFIYIGSTAMIMNSQTKHVEGCVFHWSHLSTILVKQAFWYSLGEEPDAKTGSFTTYFCWLKIMFMCQPTASFGSLLWRVFLNFLIDLSVFAYFSKVRSLFGF